LEENLFRLKVVGVEENRKDPPLPLATGGIIPNCFAPVFRGFGGLSVAFKGPQWSNKESIEDVRFFVGVSKELLRDFEKEGSNVKADLWGLVHSKSIGDSAERACRKHQPKQYTK
jgi:hypothetical protein